MKQKEAEAEERRKELIKKRQTAVMTLKASFAASQVQLISRKAKAGWLTLLSYLRPYVLDSWVKRGAELYTDQDLVVSWIKWQGRLPTQTNCEGELREFGRGSCPIDLKELFLWRSYSLIPREAGDMETEWGLFKASIVGAAASMCGCRGWTRWWTLTVREAVRRRPFGMG